MEQIFLSPVNNTKNSHGFLFRSVLLFRTTRELEYLFFFVAKKANFFFRNATLEYMTKTLNQIIFFPPPKSEYFLQQHWESEYFFRKKKHNPPPLQVKWSFPYNFPTRNEIINDSHSLFNVLK